jgi:MFS family permease
VFPPYSESFGRKKLYLFSTILFAAFSILIARASSIAAVFVGRFITGLVSAVPSVVAAGSIEDIFVSKTRTWLVTVWLVIANLSLVLGPIFASYVSASIGW